MTFTVTFLSVGVSYLLLLLLSLGDHTFLRSYLPFMLILFSFPHFMATYGIWMGRVREWKREWWPLIFPFVYLGIFILSLKGKFPLRFELIIKLSYVYLIYHFSQQLYGVTLWMVGQKKIQLDRWAKYLLRTIFILMGFYTLLELELRGATQVLFYSSIPLFPFPPVLFQVTMGLFFLCAVVFVMYAFWRVHQTKNIFFLTPLLGVGAAFIWFIPPFSHDMVYYLPIVHGLQYYPFIYMKMRHLAAWKWVLFIVSCGVSGWVLFRWLPFTQGIGPMSGVLWTSMILTLLNNHHFIIDGRIWKLSDPRNEDLKAG